MNDTNDAHDPQGATPASVLLTVADSGLGLSREQQAHLFEPFNRLGAEAMGIEGTGIGLAIVKSLVERMGGQVSVSSTAGQGSRFQVRLQAAPGDAPSALTAMPTATAPPASGPAQAPAPGTTSPPSPTTPAASVAAGPSIPVPRHQLLYIEDNAVNALIISELVARRPDLQLHIASDGLSGVAMAQQLLPALVLLDMQLPDIDGHEVMRRLRATPATAALTCVALSANAMPEDIARALDAGVADYWTKPLDFSIFMQALDRLFGPAP